MHKLNTIYDVAVIGGGAAGLIAAGRAGELGSKVIVLEKNKTLGVKLLITGKGRSNLTRGENNDKEFVKQYGREGDFLLSSFSKFGPKETIDFFEKKGLKLKTERGKRIFPVSDRAGDVLNVLINYCKKNNVEIKMNAEVRDIIKNRNTISRIVLSNKEVIIAKNYIICSGGKAFPGTGSTGDGYKWAEKFGHSVISPEPALVPIKIKDSWVRKLQGLSLKNIEITVLQNNKKIDSRFGELLFTHFGLSGPIILDLSGGVGEILKKGEVVLSLDLKPALDFNKLDKRLQSDFLKYNKKMFRNVFNDLLPQKLIPVFISLSKINPDKKINEITREERHELVKLFKNIKMTVVSLLGFENAIITKGGISIKEIDSKTMRSKRIDNLFFAGEIINLHGPTGGYNLQLAWTTGFISGENAAQ